MIVTLTAHPALDRTVALASPLAVGEVHQAESQREDAAGKGINVARVLVASGTAARAVLPLAPTDPFAALLDPVLDIRPVPVDGTVRANIALTEPDGRTTKVNLPGARIDADAARRLTDAVVDAADGAGWVALCGSLPPGASADLYASIARELRANRPGVRVAVDTSGPALVEALRAGGIDLIKPNEDELVDAIVALEGLDDAEAARLRAVVTDESASDDAAVEAVTVLARRVVPAHAAAALVTLGGRGAVLVTADGAWHATAPAGTRVRSTVGAGDSSLAGYLLADGAEAPDRLATAVRYGSATASLPGTALAAPGDLSTSDISIRALA